MPSPGDGTRGDGRRRITDTEHAFDGEKKKNEMESGVNQPPGISGASRVVEEPGKEVGTVDVGVHTQRREGDDAPGNGGVVGKLESFKNTVGLVLMQKPSDGNGETLMSKPHLIPL